jgi:polysaccharide deacetylase family protein (PEP-CTERM system associated)
MQSNYTSTPVSPVMREDTPTSDNATSPEPYSLGATDSARTPNAMTVDVEDYYQVEAFSHQVSLSDWPNHEGRVERNVERLLRLLADHDVHGTFFTLGWIAERYPGLIKRIVDAGHELASHGYDHTRVDRQSQDDFRLDARKTKQMLEDLGGVEVRGYRAASFSVSDKTPWVFEILADEGYRYSSSIYPIRHDLYGMPSAPRFAYVPDENSSIIEVPITTVSLLNRKLPCGGGGYFRLYPYAFSRWAMRRVNGKDHQPCVFYLHPWEIDPEQPRMSDIPLKTRVRHYLNLRRMESRLCRLLGDFAWDRMDRIFLEDRPGAT